MKNSSILSLISVFTFFQLSNIKAQNYLISFAGTGETTTVSTVEVENINSGATLVLNGGDILRLTPLTGISAARDNYSQAIRIYPNPMVSQSTVCIFPPEEGNAIISLYDLTGKLIIQYSGFLKNSAEEFRISGLNSGIYVVHVLGNSYHFSEKLLCTSKKEGTPLIEMISSSNKSGDDLIILKSAEISPNIVDMPYQIGDPLKFKVTSGIYSTIKTDIPTKDKTLAFHFIRCTDGDDTNYPVVEIGSQCWMAENLKTTRYNDGTPIPLVSCTDEWRNLKTAGFCWYNNDEKTNKSNYGALYNWFAANTSDLCPTGWHVPTDEEWKTLEMFLGMSWESANSSGFRGTDQGTQLKSTTGWECGGNGSNSSGFSGLPSGARWLDTGNFHSMGIFAGWWSSTEIFGDGALIRYVYYSCNTVNRMADYSSYMGKQNGFSIRCVKD